MIELNAHNVVDYLRNRGELGSAVPATAEPLAWGVSNVVLRVFPAIGDDLVVKQSREQLRTKAEWFSRLNRIWREADVMRVLGDILPPGAVPRILFEDRDNYVFGMEAVAADHVVWKESLLKGDVDLNVATTVAEYLATIHRQTANDEPLGRRFGDRTVFRELRVDPFYRTIGEVHAELTQPIEALIAQMEQHAVCLVLADFSPKNILVTDTGVTLVDFETGHYGDPAFDLGFFLSHILLKGLMHAPEKHQLFLNLAEAFWKAYSDGLGSATSIEALAIGRRTCRHLAACALSRIDGTSRVDYLDDAHREQAREWMCAALQSETARDDPVDLMRFWLAAS